MQFSVDYYIQKGLPSVKNDVELMTLESRGEKDYGENILEVTTVI